MNILYGFIIITLVTIVQLTKPVIGVSWTVSFNHTNDITVHMHQSDIIQLTLSGVSRNELLATGGEFIVQSDNTKLLTINKRIPISEISETGIWIGPVELDAQFLGTTNVFVELYSNGEFVERSDQQLTVIIIREQRTIDHVFTGSVATLVSILYINFGAALSLSKLRGIITRPIGPAIGFFGQFVIMPLLSFGLGYALFPDNPEMQLGMFFTGASPAGGASNIWTVLLGGNLDLSIAMTSISNILSFGMMPFWLFTLGKVIFDRGEIEVPYQNLSTYLIALIIPLAIGLLIQRFLPRVAYWLVRVLKPLSSLLIIFIVVFAVVTNLYLFELFSWQIIIAGLCLPWLSYILGYSAAWLFKQPPPDCLAIALETGIQNTGISIFLLRFTLPQPAADLTTVVPVSVAIMTPLPLLCLYIYQKIRDCMASGCGRRTKLDDGSIAEITPSDGNTLENGGKRTVDLLDNNDAAAADDNTSRQHVDETQQSKLASTNYENEVIDINNPSKIIEKPKKDL